MVTAYFRVDLLVNPLTGGQAELVVPKTLEGHDYRFIIVKDGAEEAIIQLKAPSDFIKQVEKDKKCKKLTKEEMTKLMESYPRPRIKKKFQEKVEKINGEGETPTFVKVFELDTSGNKIVDTVQTVRAGIHMIDVSVLTTPGE